MAVYAIGCLLDVMCPTQPTSSKHAVPRDQCKWVRPCPRNGTFMKYAVLIDAGFLKRRICSRGGR